MSSEVVITGLGAVSAYGFGADALWEGLLAGRSGVGRISAYDPSGFACQVAGEIHDYKAKNHVPKHYRKGVKVMARDIELAVGAAEDAVASAGVVTKAADPDSDPTYPTRRVCCHIGAGLIAAEVPELAMALATSTDDSGKFSYDAWGEGAINNLTPLWLLKYLPNMLSCHVTILHDAQGPSNTITCQEASGLLSIGEAVRVILRGDADAGFAGGVESKVNPMGHIRLQLSGRLANIEVAEGEAFDVANSYRPYDRAAPGSIHGEGGGILFIESKESARQRGAKVIAEIAGFGAGHTPAGDAQTRSRGLQRAIRAALDDAGISSDEVDAIVPHAAGEPEIDAEEACAFRAVFGERISQIELVTLTWGLGDTMAGAGGLAAIVGALCLKHQTLPARLHASGDASGLQAGGVAQRDASLRHVLVCTNSLGGQNAAVLLRAATES